MNNSSNSPTRTLRVNRTARGVTLNFSRPVEPVEASLAIAGQAGSPAPVTAAGVKFLKGQYMSSHLRSPRGRGRWGFCPRDKWTDPNYTKHVIWVEGDKPFGQARKEAALLAAARGISQLVVCP